MAGRLISDPHASPEGLERLVQAEIAARLQHRAVIVAQRLRFPLSAGDPASPGGTLVTSEELDASISGGVPSATVVTEIAFDQVATAGVATTASRGDHSHGTPPNPATKTTFTFSTSSPLDFGVLAAGDEILDSEVIIETAFNDPGAMLALGQVSSPGNILPIAAIDPTTVGSYHSGENFVVTGADAIRLQILPGASTLGAGRVVVTIRRP